MGRPSPATIVGGARCSLRAFQMPKPLRTAHNTNGGDTNSIARGRRAGSTSVFSMEKILRTELRLVERFPSSSEPLRTNLPNDRVKGHETDYIPLGSENVEEVEINGPHASRNAVVAEEYDRWRPYNPTDPSSSKAVFNRKLMKTEELSQGEPLYEELQAYKLHFKRFLDTEVDDARDRIIDRQAKWPLEDLIDEGYTLKNLSSYEYIHPGEKRHDGCTFGFVPSAGETLGVNLFLRGSQVTVVTNTSSPLDYISNNQKLDKGTVIYSTPDEIRIRFLERSPRLLTAKQCRMDVWASDIGRQRMLAAIHALNYNPADMEAASSWKGEYEVDGTYLRGEILHGWAKSEAASASLDDGRELTLDTNQSTVTGLFTSDERIRDWVRRYSLPIPERQGGDPELDLNTSQIHAIAQMIGEKFSLVQGPPGTGKTRTIIESIRILKAHFKVPIPLLVCTYTNAAVDNLVEGIAAAGLKPLRVGSESSVGEGLAEWSLNAQMQQHSQWGRLVSLKQQEQDVARELSTPPEKGEQTRSSELKEKLDRLRDSIKSLRRSMQYHILRSADVVCTTCLTAGSRILRLMDFPAVFLDEASMSTEPASLIPLMRGSRHVALIGDHKQLPPVITSGEARSGGLARSLFERFMDKNQLPSIMLNTQYRMHPSISAFPSREFYDRGLENGTLQADLPPPRSTHLLQRRSKTTGLIPSVLFVHHDNYETARDRSRANIEEMYIAIAILEDLLISNPEMQGRDIGVIAPYVAQIRMLDATLKSDIDWEESFRMRLGERRALQMKEIEVKTVDGFEGREKEVIIFSTVRNNSYGRIGFLADRRRMNVALTRAKRALFVIGSMTTLAQGRYGAGREEPEKDVAKMIHGTGDEWKKFIQFVHAEELFTEYNRPAEYRSPEEVLEFDLMAKMPILRQG